ncbi:MAG: hypothetical protein V3V78_02155 [Candidatus Woesearchaeota archaeon]
MAMKIISQTEQPLLSRTQVTAHIIFEAATPSNEDVAKEIAKQTKKDVKLVVIKKINTHYGSKEADVDAYVYSSEEEMKKVEPQPKKKEAKPGEAPAPKAETAPAAEAKPEAKAKPAEAKEEKAEAKPEEAKPEEKKEEPKKEE